MRYVDVRGLNNFQSLLTPRRVPSVIRSYREVERYGVQAALAVYFQQLGNVAQTPTEEGGQLTACGKWSVTWNIQDERAGCLVRARRQRRKRDETEMEEDGCSKGRRAPVWFSARLSRFPPKSLRRRLALDRGNRFLNMRWSHAHTLGVSWGSLSSASPLAWGRGVASLCLQSAVRSRARWRWAGPQRCWGEEGGDWAAASICVS